MPNTPVIQLPRLGKQQMVELTSKSRRLGMTPARYVQSLIEADLALDRKAHSTTFAELMGPGRPTNESELDRLVDEARTRHHKKRRVKR
jgi:hypothetical protein